MFASSLPRGPSLGIVRMNFIHSMHVCHVHAITGLDIRRTAAELHDDTRPSELCSIVVMSSLQLRCCRV